MAKDKGEKNDKTNVMRLLDAAHANGSGRMHFISHKEYYELRARRIAESEGVSKSGYRLITNVGDDAGQSVHHLHLHLIGGKQLKWDN